MTHILSSTCLDNQHRTYAAIFSATDTPCIHDNSLQVHIGVDMDRSKQQPELNMNVACSLYGYCNLLTEESRVNQTSLQGDIIYIATQTTQTPTHINNAFF